MGGYCESDVKNTDILGEFKKKRYEYKDVEDKFFLTG